MSNRAATIDDLAAAPAAGPMAESAADPARLAVAEADGLKALHLMVDGIHCGGCVRKIETTLFREPDVREARVNLTTRRLRIVWQGSAERARSLVALLGDLGFRASPYDPELLNTMDRVEETALLRALGVSGFATINVMLISIAVWAGQASDMGVMTQSFLHWVSAVVALPALAYAGRPFLKSAWRALSARRTNMDVPITVGVVLTAAMSLVETARHGDHVYFESVLMLVFFLLIGRYLDRRARGKARSAAERLMSLSRATAAVRRGDGSLAHVPAEQVETGATVLVAAGARIPVDGVIREGATDLDTSLIDGEATPKPARSGFPVHAGVLNLSAPIAIETTAAGEATLLAEIVRLMEAAEQRRGRFVTLADRIVRFYTPAVHLLALGAFAGWVAFGGMVWQEALLIAVAVLIITCPCALGLAVPAVQVLASNLLMRRGVIVKSGAALERMAAIDTVVFDKTGTLTTGTPYLAAPPNDPAALSLAAGMAANSRHPLARALTAACPDAPVLDGVEEYPGAGLLHRDAEGETRLGSRRWCGVGEDDALGPELWLARTGQPPVRFGFAETLRPDAAEVVGRLQGDGLRVMLLSGDRRPTVAAVAREVGIADWTAALAPAEKVARLEALAREGRRVLMVGDGLNDAPALAAAYASMSPAGAADVSQTAADIVFQGAGLSTILYSLATSRRAERLVKQNFALALGYNLFTIPLAVAGFVTPLIAAVAMSLSSLAVTGNAFRLRAGEQA